MADLYQWFGDDFELDATGDLRSVDGVEWTQQRIVRRLLTNPGTYFQHPNYGAGLGRFIGQNLSDDKFQEIRNLIVSQILQESAVAKTPTPTVTLSTLLVGQELVLQVAIQYYDLKAQQTVYLTFTVDN